MTTIVYDHKRKRIACDGRSSAGPLLLSDNSIKYVSNKKGLWFVCGVYADRELFVTLDHRDELSFEPECDALLVKEGDCYMVTFRDNRCSYEKLEYNYAMGSGRDFALAALDFGKTAEEAIEYAKTRDVYTGGTVFVYDISKQTFVLGGSNE